MNALLAKALSAGGTIGIVSPASPYNTYSDVLRGIAWWEAHGYRVKLAEGALERKDWLAGDPETRARDLMAMFTDSSVVIGDLTGCEWNDGGGSPWPHTKTLEEMLEERLSVLGVPVIYKLPFGHGTHMATFPLGVQATLDGSTCTLEVTEPALR
jgi:muramoyltetrapeptide carboxypeptidase LdcA involved in peptidoglycan recycling